MRRTGVSRSIATGSGAPAALAARGNVARRAPPLADLARFNELVQRLALLLERGHTARALLADHLLVILRREAHHSLRPVQLQKVDVVGPETLQRSVNRLDDLAA